MLSAFNDCAKLELKYHCGDLDSDAAVYAGDCQRTLPTLIPLGLRMQVVRWWHKQLHDRFVITEYRLDSRRFVRAGATRGRGFDAAGRKEDISHVRLTLLDTATAVSIRNDFLGTPPGYERAPGCPVEVIGTRRL